MGPLNIAITGSAGFLGQAAFTLAQKRGHKVRGLTRQNADLSQPVDPALFDGVDVVLHLAASVSNDPQRLATDTAEATRNLANALREVSTPPRIVLASSIAIYDAEAKGPISESSPLESQPQYREPYMHAKLEQEQVLRERGLETCALRLGLIYDEAPVSEALVGIRKGPLLISLNRSGTVPLVHVEDAASALLLAAEHAQAENFSVYNIVEAPLPQRRDVIELSTAKFHVPLHWRVLRPIAHIASALLGGNAPGLLRPRVLRARMATQSYDSSKALRELDWSPSHLWIKEAAS